MSIRFYTSQPNQLLSKIKQAISDGHITTWSCDSDGDFTHQAVQWKTKAWLRPAIGQNVLTLKILAPKNKTISKIVYAYYHGHFAETVLNHFDNLFTSVDCSSQVRDGDRVS